MGKLFITLIFAIFLGNGILAQDTLFTYTTKGSVLKLVGTNKSALTKGSIILPGDKVLLTGKSQLQAINSKGEFFTLKNAGTYTHANLISNKQKNKGSLTSNFFKLVWDEMTHKPDGGAVVAGVFRGDALMHYPREKAKVAESKVTFKWHPTENDSIYYIFIRNKKSENFIKIEVDGSQLAFFAGSEILSAGNSYEWAVTEEAFPNLKNIPFYSFSVITRDEYDGLREKLTKLEAELKELGVTDDDITASICMSYGLCVGP